MKNPFSSRSTDLMNKDLVQMLRDNRPPSAKYAVIDAERRETHTSAPKAKLPKDKKEWFRAPKSPKLGKIFG